MSSFVLNGLDPIFSDLLGVQASWTGYIAAHLIKQKKMNPKEAFFEDVLTDLCTKLYFDLSDGGLKEKVSIHVKSTTDQDALANLIRPMFSSAIDYRFRSIIRAFRRKNSRFVPLSTDVEQKSSPSEEIDAENLREKISEAVLSRKMTPKVRQVVVVILPDRLNGMGLRELCEKHNLQRGGTALKALKEIQSCAEDFFQSRKVCHDCQTNLGGKMDKNRIF